MPCGVLDFLFSTRDSDQMWRESPDNCVIYNWFRQLTPRQYRLFSSDIVNALASPFFPAIKYSLMFQLHGDFNKHLLIYNCIFLLTMKLFFKGRFSFPAGQLWEALFFNGCSDCLSGYWGGATHLFAFTEVGKQQRCEKCNITL